MERPTVDPKRTVKVTVTDVAWTEGDYGEPGACFVDNQDATLSPSINCIGCCKWHGWLKAGVFESC